MIKLPVPLPFSKAYSSHFQWPFVSQYTDPPIRRLAETASCTCEPFPWRGPCDTRGRDSVKIVWTKLYTVKQTVISFYTIIA